MTNSTLSIAIGLINGRGHSTLSHFRDVTEIPVHYDDLMDFEKLSAMLPVIGTVDDTTSTLLFGHGYKDGEFVHIFQHQGLLHFLIFAPPSIDSEDRKYGVITHETSKSLPVRRFMTKFKRCRVEGANYTFCLGLAQCGVRLQFEPVDLVCDPRPIVAFTNVPELDDPRSQQPV